MNLKQIETFIAIVRCGSFNSAAERLNCTQSTISARVHELEQILGTVLFDRAARRVLLTTKGRELVPYAERLLDLSAEIRLRVGDSEQYAGIVRMGVAEIVAVTWLPHLVAALRERFPKLVLQLEVALNPTLTSKLSSGDLDIAVVAGSNPGSMYTVRGVGSVQFAWMASGMRELERKRYSPAELNRMPLIYQGAESATRRLMSEWIGSETVLDGHSICNSMAGIASLVAADIGIGFLPLQYHADRIADGTFQLVMTEPAPPQLDFCIAFQSRQNEAVLQIISDQAVALSTFEL